MDKIEYFKDELNYILNPKIKEFAEKAIVSLPDYFFIIPASSTGLYHPAYSLGDGGLVRHTRAAVRIAIELTRMEDYRFTDENIDLCIAALLIHDGYKSGVIQQTYTQADHPLIIANELKKSKDLNEMLPQDKFDTLLSLIIHHMGQWGSDGITEIDRPATPMEKFVHLCDYLASRRCLTMEFGVEIKREPQYP